MLSSGQTLAIIGTATICTFFLRIAPFLLFAGREVPQPIQYLGRVLPACVMAVLVVYCLKSTSFASLSGWAPQCISVAVVALLHIWKGKTLVSIVGGTACYMVLVQMVFAS